MSFVDGSVRGNHKTTSSSIRSEKLYYDGNRDSDDDNDFILLEKPCHNVEPDGVVYKVLSVDQLLVLQGDITEEVAKILNLSPGITRFLLIHFKWNKEHLYENYFESSPQEFFQRAPILNPFKQKSQRSPEASNLFNDNKECEICYCSDKELYDLGCGHSNCVACWKKYLANKTCSEGQAHTITCAAANCGILVDYATFFELVDEPKVVERYQQLITNTFVECNRLMRWCPAPNCIYAIEVKNTESKSVKCKCGHQFCFGCGENLHEPVGCSWLKNWLNLNFEDSETSDWIYRNTKKCPQCQVAIQKDGGCNHMSCKKPSCHYEFCWLCLRSWKAHRQEVCNSFEKAANESALLTHQTSRETKARYQLHKDRYMNYMQSMKNDRKLYAKIDDLQAGISRIKGQFLCDAVDALCQCRSTLMYSYVFSFYLKNNNQKLIFEYNQRDLERATDKISECLEREITVQNLCKIKKRVIDVTQYCQQRRRVLLNHVQEGNKKEWWDFVNEKTLQSL